jgi:predicted hydrocarbon binding protein
MRYPRDLAVWEHAPGRKLAEIVVRLKNVKGALAQCSKAVAAMDINMLSGFETASSVSRMGDWSFFADLTDSKVDIDGLRRRLLDLPEVVDVEILPADDGFMVDRQHFPVRFSNRRALILRTEAMSEMISHMWQVFGSGAATIIDQMAESMGRYTAQELIEDFGKEFIVSALDEVLQTYSALGFAEIEVARERGAEESLTVHAHQLFECEANARKKLRRKSIFFRGHLRGFVSTVFHRDFEVAEVQCLAEGDEACSFVVAKVESMVPRMPLASDEQN